MSENVETVEAVTLKLADANKRIIDAEIRSLARASNATNGAELDAVALIDRSNITMDDEGNVTGVAEAVEALKASKPYLFKPVSSGGADASGASNRSTDRNKGATTADKRKLEELAETARKTGRTQDKVAYASFKRTME